MLSRCKLKTTLWDRTKRKNVAGGRAETYAAFADLANAVHIAVAELNWIGRTRMRKVEPETFAMAGA
eukprot:2645419-Rhodomonas_salina.1